MHTNRSIFRKFGVSPFQSMQVRPENCELKAHLLRAINGSGTPVAGLDRRQHVAQAAVGAMLIGVFICQTGPARDRYCGTGNNCHH